MKSFFAACLAAIVLAVVGVAVLDGVVQETAEQAFVGSGAKL